MDKHLKAIEILRKPDFPDFLKQFDLPITLHSELLAAHILCIGAYSSGIAEGGINISYIKSVYSSDPEECTNIPFFQLQYYFYTRKGSLIENSNYSARNSQKIHHLLYNEFRTSSYGYRELYYDPRSFRDFLNSYIKKHRVSDYNNEHLENANNYHCKMGFTCSNDKKNRENELYEQLVLQQPNIEAFFNWFRYNNSIKEKNIVKNRNKI